MSPLEIALDAALVVLRNGGSSSAAERSFDNILKGAQLEGAAAIWRLDFIAAYHGTDRAHVRAVGPIGVNLARVSEVLVVSQRVADGRAPVSDLPAELARIERLPSPYGHWLTVGVAGAAAACFSQLLGGDWGSVGITFVAAPAGQALRSALQARGVAAAPVTLISGLLSALIGAIGLRLGFSEAPAATMIGSIIYLVPGLPLINGFLDIVSHSRLMVGFERVLNAAYLFLILSITIALAKTLMGD